MKGRVDGEIITNNNDLFPTLVGTVGLQKTGKLLHTWKNPELKNSPGTGNLPLAGNHTTITVQIINIATSAINTDREMATLASLATSATTSIATDRGKTRARNGKTRTSNGETGSSQKTRTQTSSRFFHLLSIELSLNTKIFSWTRRDTNQVSSVNQIPLKRRPHRSKSRSVSPTNSIYSRRSSHGGRSRSRSPSPKRVRHSVSPVGHDFSPANKRQKWKKNRLNDNQQIRDRGRARRSPSPVYSASSRSVSSSSSRSSGAGDRPRTLHRLPTATNVRDIDITLSMSKTTTSWDRSPKNTRRARDQSTSPKVEVSCKSRNDIVRLPDHTPFPSGPTSDQCLSRTPSSISGPICSPPPFQELSINLVPKVLSNWPLHRLRRGRRLGSSPLDGRPLRYVSFSPQRRRRNQCFSHATKRRHHPALPSTSPIEIEITNGNSCRNVDPRTGCRLKWTWAQLPRLGLRVGMFTNNRPKKVGHHVLHHPHGHLRTTRNPERHFRL